MINSNVFTQFWYLKFVYNDVSTPRDVIIISFKSMFCCAVVFSYIKFTTSCVANFQIDLNSIRKMFIARN